MNKTKELSLLISLQNKKSSRESGEDFIDKMAKYDRNGETEEVVEDVCRSIIALLEEEKCILNELEK